MNVVEASDQLLQRAAAGACLLAAALLFFMGACRSEAADEHPVRSHLEGRVTVSAAVDSIPDYRGFEVLVAAPAADTLDTLGYAVTDREGRFAMTIAAPDRGIYSLAISRRGTVLQTGQLVVADGDSARFTAELPMGRRPLHIRSFENAAWLAYRNARQQYNATVLQQLQQDSLDRAAVRRQVEQTANIMWGLQEQYPRTVGADLAAAEAVALLDGWNDSLLVARARSVASSNRNYVTVARAARRAEARQHGQQAAMALLQDFLVRTTDPEQQAALQAEVVVAHRDSLERTPARRAAQVLKDKHASSAWAQWADRALYEIDHLMPGQPAPAFTVTTQAGRPVRLDNLRGRYVVLEFYRPEDPIYQSQLGQRNQLQEIAGPDTLTYVSVSLQPDTLLNQAFLDGRDVPGLHVIAPKGPDDELAQQYNVHVLPTRYLIAPDGTIQGKYVRHELGALLQDLAALVAGRLARGRVPS